MSDPSPQRKPEADPASPGTSTIAPPPRRQPASSRTPVEEAAILDRLHQTRRQVKRVDLVVTLATMLTGILFYLLIGAVLDQWVARDGLGFFGRAMLFAGLIGGSTVFFIARVWPLLRFDVNPVYAASILEQCRPNFKNGLINWLLLRSDYRQRPTSTLQQRIYLGLTRSAGADLEHTPREMVVDHTPVIRWGTALVAVVAVFCLYLIFSPKNPIVSTGRILMPWSEIRPPQSVSFSEIEPGNTTVFQGETLQVTADVDRSGDQPVDLVYFTVDRRLVGQHVPMVIPEGDYRHQCRFPPNEEGFQEDVIYHLESGDAKSPSYRVTVRPALAIDVVSIHYDYPDYTQLADQVVRNTGDLRAVEGTRATLRARANTPIDRAMILWDGDSRNAERMKVDPNDARFVTGVFPLRFDPDDPEKQQHQTYRLRFFDEEGNVNPEPSVYRIEVIPDRRPEIRWIDPPTAQVNLPYNGRLKVSFQAKDSDFGLRHLRLHLESEEKELPVIELLDAPQSKPVTGRVEIIPRELGLTIGKQYEYSVEAIDTKLPKPNTASTTKLSFQVIDPEKSQESPDQEKGSAEEEDSASEDSSQQDPSQGDGSREGEKQEGDSQYDRSQEGEPSEEGNTSEQESPGETGETPQESDSQEGSGESQEASEGESGTSSGGEASTGESADQDDSATSENRQQRPKDPPPESPGQNESREETPEDTHQQKDQQQGPKQGGGTSSGRPDVDQQKGSPSDSQQGGARSEEGGTPSNESTGSENQAAGQSDTPGGSGQTRRKKPIDGKSNPGDVFEEVLEHMNEKEEQPQEKSGPSAGDPSDEESREKAPGAMDSGQNGESTEESAEERTPGEVDPDQGERTEEGTPPEELPENERRASEGDEKDAYRAESGQSDPGAKQADPEKPIYQDPDDPNAGEKTDEEATGQSQKPWERDASEDPSGKPSDEQASDADSSAGENPSSEAGRPGSEPSEQTEEGTEKTDDPGRGNGGGAPDEASRSPKESDPQDSPPDNRNLGGTGGDGENRRNVQPQGDAGGDAANREYAEKATSLALEYLEDQLDEQQPDQELMDKLGWTRGELEEFVRRWRKMSEAAKVPRADPEATTEWSEALKSLGLAPRGLRQEARAGGGLRTPTLESRRHQPPPGWKERFRAYTQGMAAEGEDEP